MHTKIKDEEIKFTVFINNGYKIADLKQEVQRKLSKIAKVKNSSKMGIIKENYLLQDNLTLTEANLKDDDHLLIAFEDHNECSDEELRDKENSSVDEQNKKKTLAPENLIPILSKPHYFCTPDIKKLCRMSEEELKSVKNFTIENQFGKVIFDGYTDVLGLNLDKLVEIKKGVIEVYPESENKPPLGQKLNKPAEIHLYHCIKKSTKKTKEEIVENMKKATEKQDVKYICLTK